MKSNVQSASPRHINMFRVHVYPEAIDRATSVLRSGYIGEGPVVKELEESFAKVSGAPWNLCVNSGTSALHLAVILAGVDAGDEVITTAQTMMATSHAILMQRAVPVFTDIQLQSGNIDPTDIEHRITDRTKSILVVHWAGYPCDMDEIHSIADKYNIMVIEDAAHAIGAVYKGMSIGNISPITCFSFQAIKHITGGDGGMLSLQNEEHKIQGSRLRWFGIDRDLRKYSILGEPEWNVTRLGFKYQMTDIAAAIALANLNHLDQILTRRKQIAQRYRESLTHIDGITLLESKADRESAYWVFTLLVERRVDFIRMLHSKGVFASVVHMRIDRNEIFGGQRHDLPNLDLFTEKHVSLPIYESLSDEDVVYIINSIKQGW